MAYDRGGSWAYYDAAAQVTTGRLKIKGITIRVGATAATAAAPVTLKDGAGTVIGHYAGVAESTIIIEPHDWWVDGLELDAMPAGVTMTVYFA